MTEKQSLRRHRELVNLLLKEGLITDKMLEYARQEAQMSGLNIEKALIKLELVTEEDIVKVRANALGIPYMDLSDYIIDPEIIAMVPKEVCLKFNLIPLFKISNSITVGMVDPQDIVALDQIRRICKIDTVDPGAGFRTGGSGGSWTRVSAWGAPSTISLKRLIMRRTRTRPRKSGPGLRWSSW